jgi:TetR/AcrR family fatty acid metabolism transcriptional regulator
MSKKALSKMKSEQPGPAGKVKLADALRELLENKDFSSITTATIAKTAGVNEALIYRYYGDKRGLLHHLLSDYLDFFIKRISSDLKGVEGAVNKLQKLIWVHIYLYDYNRVFAKILLLEVRNYPGYFTSETYRTVKVYTNMLLELIEEGIENKEFRNDIPATHIRQFILGGIEHICLPSIIFDKKMDVDLLHKEFCSVIFNGIRPKHTYNRKRKES